MKSTRHLLALLAIVLATLVSNRSFAWGPQDLPEGFTPLEIGDSAPDFKLPGVDGETYTLKDFDGPEVLMILFTGTHCPTSHSIETRLQEFVNSMKDESFAIVAINPNHSSGLRPDEFGHTTYDETFEDSRRYAGDLGWTFPFLYDGDEQITARAYGCLATPHVFIFDKERKLRYNGRYDDSRLPGIETVKSHDAVNATKALLAGEPVPVQKTRPHGCSTKWKERSQHVAEEEAQWQTAEVTVETIDAAKIAKLRKNGSGKVRLFNVWATWCGPCVEEMPDLSDISRKFSRREFELITISLDLPDEKEKVETFLGKHRIIMSDKLRKTVEAEGRTTNNYIFAGANTNELAEALDPKWPGPVPYTILVNERGKILYRVSGMIDPVKVKNAILDQMGNYHSVQMKR